MELSFLNLFLQRSGQLQDFIWHLGTCNLKPGDTSAVTIMETV